MDFAKKFDLIVTKNNSLLCVGLDPELKKIPKNFKSLKESLFEFNKWIVDQTFKNVCAYKPNIAFYEAYGLEGFAQLKKTIVYLKKNYPTVPIILDCKRADIANTARMYAKAIYEYWDVDSATIYPHLGLDSIEPFLKYKDKLTILLVKTSNPDSSIFQNLETDKGPYYLAMAEVINNWKLYNTGIFVGATYPQELRKLRKIFPDKIFLSAGIGAQKGTTKEAVQAGIDKNGRGIIFNVSRSIIYSHNPKLTSQQLKDEINKFR